MSTRQITVYDCCINEGMSGLKVVCGIRISGIVQGTRLPDIPVEVKYGVKFLDLSTFYMK